MNLNPVAISYWYCVYFQDRVSLYSPSCPGTCFVDQAGLEFRDLPASASRVLGLKACVPLLALTSALEEESERSRRQENNVNSRCVSAEPVAAPGSLWPQPLSPGTSEERNDAGLPTRKRIFKCSLGIQT